MNNQINVSIKVIDSYTKMPRINDTVTISEDTWGIPMRRYVEIGEYITDSIGIVRVKLNKNTKYIFESDGSNNAYGSTEYLEGELKENNQVIIEVVPPDKKKFHF